jgi:hypothetical protein
MVAAIQQALATEQFAEGTVRTARSIRVASSIAYGTGARSAANRLADELGVRAIASDAVAPDTVLLTVGTDLRASDSVESLASAPEVSATSETPIPTAVPATAAGNEAPMPANLTEMTAGAVPCVR